MTQTIEAPGNRLKSTQIDIQRQDGVMTLRLNGACTITEDPKQWIVQYLSGDIWKSKSFCATRSGLQHALSISHYNVGQIYPEVLREIISWPEQHGEPKWNLKISRTDKT